MDRPYWLSVTAILAVLIAACGGSASSTTGQGADATRFPQTNPAQSSAIRGERAATPFPPIGAESGGELSVFAAASLTEAFTEMAEAFGAANGGAEVTFNFAGSQQLAQQIAQGAPADVFASAGGKQMDALVESGQVRADGVQPFARNRLVVILPESNPGRIRTLKDLSRRGVKLDLAAEEAPVGQYSLAFLDAAAKDPEYGATFRTGALANVVSYEENVKAVVAKVSQGEADAGIVYESDVAVGAGARLGTIAIPAELNQVATYPIAMVEGARHPELAQAWLEYARSPEGQATLRRHGFLALGG